MKNKVYVGNLPWSISSDDLSDLCKEFGEVRSANVVMDRATGRSRGFGFVEMSGTQEASATVQGLDGRDMDGRRLRVDLAH